ncbi:hypothetical protein CCACVL1_07186 [Corchorus capsularis]|uniref:Uncharacterized protein n=1 Tax=Corchorus capsularis TaxID=210143 RepID=A0A1R3J8T9_COCAP|nr:hypothetical protein CCACVL1_07186 [Corchorus capsularis]
MAAIFIVYRRARQYPETTKTENAMNFKAINFF